MLAVFPLVLAPPAAAAARRSIQFPAHGAFVQANLDEHSSYSDVWGYTAPDGREYALLGTFHGTAVIDVTNRRAPREVGFVPGPGSTWRDIKTCGPYAYVVNETGGGLQIVSLADPTRPAIVTPGFGGFATAHNLYVDEATGTAFIAGRNAVLGVQILSLQAPRAPTVVGTWDDTYVHDVFARDGVLYASAIHAGVLYLLDLADPTLPSTIGIVGPYPGSFTHNAWPTEDGRHVLTTDERGGAAVRMWDISEPLSPAMTDLWKPYRVDAIPHNVHVRGSLAFVSWYTAGVRVLDISDPEDIVEVALHDTHPESDSPAFAGCWGVFPFYPNSPQLFVASDISRGLFVLELDDVPGAGLGAFRDEPEEDAAPLRLGSPSPNPAPGGRTRIPLSLESPGLLRVGVFDAGGRLVRRLVSREAPAGPHLLAWDGRDGRGGAVAAGTYFVRVEGSGAASVRKVVVSR
jgi:choice-of-anchor B domain-containing protein